MHDVDVQHDRPAEEREAARIKRQDEKDQDVALRRVKKLQITAVLFAVSVLFFVLVTLGLTLHEGQARESDLEKARIERLAQINRVNKRQCDALENLYKAIRISIMESTRTINTIDYYKANPNEKRQALLLNRRALNRYKVPPCPPDITIPLN